MRVNRSAYYDWHSKPVEVITAERLHLYRRAKTLFKDSRESLGSRELSKKLREEGFVIGRYATRTIMRKLKLKVTRRVVYKITTKRKHSDDIADNLLNQNFNPVAVNEVWAGDITYLHTNEGWMYLAIVMDLFSRRIVGWHMDKRMTSSLISKALMKAVPIADPRHRKTEKDLNFKAIPSPVHSLDYVAEPSVYRQVSDGHFVLTTENCY